MLLVFYFFLLLDSNRKTLNDQQNLNEETFTTIYDFIKKSFLGLGYIFLLFFFCV